jgi:AraC family transcriptional activator of pobA
MKSSPVRIDDAAGRAGPIFADWSVNPSSSGRRSAVTHDFAALAFYVGGAARIEQREVWTLEAGDVLIVPAGEAHRLVDAQRAHMWRLGLCVPCVVAETSAGLLEPFERVRDGASPVVRVPPTRHDFLERLFRELMATSTRGDDAPVRQSLLTLIVNEVARAAASTTVRGPARSIVSDTLRFIERHCLEPLTLDDIASAMNRTPSYVTTAVSRATGRSAGAWIIAGRMAEARRRLLHSIEPVEGIAGHIGYADATHFIRIFRRVHGVTPAAWRAARRSTAVTPAHLPSPCLP